MLSHFRVLFNSCTSYPWSVQAPSTTSQPGSAQLSTPKGMAVVVEENTKRRFLILHDYGMGGSWWWVRARSAREVLETFAEVEVIEASEAIELA